MHLLMRTLMGLLERDPIERFRLPERAYPEVDQALARAAAADDAEEQLAEALKLIVALRHTLASPSAARALRARIKAVPSARAWMRRLGPRPGDAQRRFRAQQDLGAPPRAPVLGSAPPPGSIRAARVIDPANVDRARAHTRNPQGALRAARPRGAKS